VSAHDASYGEPPRKPLKPVAKGFAYLLVIALGLATGCFVGFVVALFTGLIPFTC